MTARFRVSAVGQCQHHYLRVDQVARGVGECRGDRRGRGHRHDRLWALGFECAVGRALQLEHPTFRTTVRRIAKACATHGKLARGSAETEAQIDEYWRLGCKVLNLPGTDVSTYLLKARAGRANARLKSIGVPVP